jgi:hypothetical protein
MGIIMIIITTKIKKKILLVENFKFFVIKIAGEKASNNKTAICGLIKNRETIPNININLRLFKLRDAHKIKLMAVKTIESFPNPEDQKLTEGINTIRVAKSLIFLGASSVTHLRLASKASKPIIPKIPNKIPIEKKERLAS